MTKSAAGATNRLVPTAATGRFNCHFRATTSASSKMTARTTSARTRARRATQEQVSAAPLPLQTCAPRAQAHATATSHRVSAPARTLGPRPNSRLQPDDIHLINAKGDVGGDTTHGAEREPERNAVQGCNHLPGMRAAPPIAFREGAH